jgi:hypothetical protein
MAQAVSHRLVSSEACVCVLVNSFGIFRGQSGTEVGLSPSYRVSRVSIIPPWLFLHIYHLGDEQVATIQRQPRLIDMKNMNMTNIFEELLYVEIRKNWFTFLE